MNKQQVFLCKHCQHELTPPRAGMRLQEINPGSGTPDAQHASRSYEW